MPIYEYRCRACGQQFEKLVRTFDPGEISCLFCRSLDVEKLLSSPLIRMGKSSESTSEFTAKDAEVNYYKDKKDYDRAAKAAEKAGKSDWEIKDLYRKAGKKT
jgi:putative FmdB family regulatory protein